MALHDASVAFFHATLDEWLVAIPPVGLRRPGHLWQLKKALYGTRRASQLWQTYIGDMFVENQWRRVTPCPGAFYSPELDITTGVHGDDFLTEGTPEALDKLDIMLATWIEIKYLGRLGPGPSGGVTGKILKRNLAWRP